jgi:lysozyme family protein
MNFKEAVEIILYHEGGYVFNPKDPGGETNFGIAKKYYADLDIKNLKRADASAIYERDYWGRYGIAKLPPCLRLLVFDAAVNQGGGTAILMLQQALGVKETKRIDDETLEKIRTANLATVIQKFVYFRWRRYTENKNFDSFGAGWGKRLLDVSLECVLRSPPDPIPPNKT